MSTVRRFLVWLNKPAEIDPRAEIWCSRCKTLGPVDDGAYCWNCGHLIPGMAPTKHEARSASLLDRIFGWLR